MLFDVSPPPSRYSTLYIISKFRVAYSEMSAVVSQAEASKPQEQKKMQECFKCKAAGFPNQLIGFEKIGENATTGKGIWKLIDENGAEHKHMYQQAMATQQHQYEQQFSNYSNGSNTGNMNKPSFRRRRVVDMVTVTDLAEARTLLSQGWDFQASYPATLANIPHYLLVKKE
jgi:hypothetical protein